MTARDTDAEVQERHRTFKTGSVNGMRVVGTVVEKVGKPARFSPTIGLGLTLPTQNQSSNNDLGALKIAVGLDDFLAGHTSHDIPPPWSAMHGAMAAALTSRGSVAAVEDKHGTARTFIDLITESIFSITRFFQTSIAGSLDRCLTWNVWSAFTSS